MSDQTVSTLEVDGGPTVHVYRSSSDGRWVVDIDTSPLAGDDVKSLDSSIPRMRLWVNDALLHDEDGHCRVLA